MGPPARANDMGPPAPLNDIGPPAGANDMGPPAPLNDVGRPHRPNPRRPGQPQPHDNRTTGLLPSLRPDASTAVTRATPLAGSIGITVSNPCRRASPIGCKAPSRRPVLTIHPETEVAPFQLKYNREVPSRPRRAATAGRPAGVPLHGYR